MSERQMPSEYFNVRFRIEISELIQSAQFAIITAFATTGQVWPEDRNSEGDQRLKDQLKRRGGWYARITGFSPDTGHSEPGWAADLSLEEARELGRQFLQHAIYFVADGQLFVTECHADSDLVPVGRFSDFLSME